MRYESPAVEGDFSQALFEYIDAHDGPSLSAFVQHEATRDQVLDLLKVRSVYHLKEADPVAWVIPRVAGAVGVALMSVQFDEYGAGDPARLHSRLFATGMTACGLAREEADYVDGAPMEVLAQNNAMSMFGLHRRLRAAALGHLAAFEATSSLPSRRMSQGLRRVGLPQEMQAYYDEHVEADAVHEQVVIRQVCAELVRMLPALVDDVFFGAHTCLDLESRMATRMLERWAGPEAEVERLTSTSPYSAIAPRLPNVRYRASLRRSAGSPARSSPTLLTWPGPTWSSTARAASGAQRPPGWLCARRRARRFRRRWPEQGPAGSSKRPASHPRWVRDDEREQLVIAQGVLHAAVAHVDAVSETSGGRVGTSPNARHVVRVDHHQSTRAVPDSQQSDLTGATAQLEHGTGGQLLGEPEGPPRLLSSPGTRFQDPLVVADLQTSEVDVPSATRHCRAATVVRHRRSLMTSSSSPVWAWM